MFPRRFLHALIALLAVLCLSAVPAATASTAAPAASAPAFEDGEWIDEAELAEDPFEFDENVPTDEFGCEVSGDEDSESGDEEDFEFRQVGDDEDVLEDEDSDLFEDELSDEELADEGFCDTLDEVFEDEIVDVDASRLHKKGVLTADVVASGAGRLVSTLTLPGTGSLGKARQSIDDAGPATIRIKLTKRGRKVLRNAKQTLSLTLGTKLALEDGTTVARSQTLDVKPKKKPGKKGSKKKQS
jgi:hypothetical protein